MTEDVEKERQKEPEVVNKQGLEVIGVNPIPDSARTAGAGKIFNFWAMASASATTPLAGLLLYGVGVTNFVAIVLLSLLIGLVPAALFSEMGRQFPVPALVVSRKTYGYGTSNALSFFYTVVNLGWFGINDATGGLILASLTGTNPVIWYVVMGIIQVVLVLYGFKWLEYFYRYTAPLLVISYAILTYFLFTSYHIDWSKLLTPTSNVNWGLDLTLILSFSILSWTYKISTSTRFATPWEKTKGVSRFLYAVAPGIGIMVPVLLMGIVGYASQAYAGNWNVAAVHFPLTSGVLLLVAFVASLGASLAIIHTNAMNLYPATADLLTAIQPFFRDKTKEQWAQPISTGILGALAVALAIAGILQHVENFLLLVADLIFPYTFVVIVDWYVRLWGKVPAQAFYRVPKGFWGNFNVKAVIATAVGIALSALTIPVGPLFNYFPQPVFASLVAALLYYALLRLPMGDT
ncbi:allantoin permease [Sulfodiicoccus acidiphilus]|uniref:Allantoin permease n=1 Tax=Sulfodiicoccus acidiphilus TaxID=1670455 RepID=A0A348B6D8_9CREN|nr:cytosine permease [Sulfodiicoccus acidiphilus]BBD73740.1 allantoin permease [Sulfodiicoccus acidiphilus]GGT97999.1 allantoin permease [Sulfodiicoccus acidiphilus]